ncbi:MAG: AAA family ATPase [Muribaculaceae bacterium]|nr:AAA family ATPase [Muribaculaceae bacterium]
MIKSLEIRNLRGIKSAEIEGLSQINLFFGKNNCGKSTVLEALFLISGQSNPTLPLSINSMRNYSKFAEGDLKVDFYNLDPRNKIFISSKGDEHRSLEISQIKSHSNTVDLDSLRNGTSENAAKRYGIKLDFSVGANKYTSDLILKEGNLKNGKANIDQRYNETIFSQYIPAANYQGSLNDEFARIVANKQESYILSALREIDPNIKDIQLVGDEILVDIGAEQRLPINMTGDGLRKLLMIIISIFRCKNGIILIDEIDNGLHFSAMKVLWKAILIATRENNVQLFATTHNIDSLKGLSYILGNEDFSSYREEISAYKLIRGNNGVVSALKYDYQSFRYSINQELEMR